MALGWKSSYRLLQQIHRKLCFLPKPMETALDPSREFRRDGPVPRSGRPHNKSIRSKHNLTSFAHLRAQVDVTETWLTVRGQGMWDFSSLAHASAEPAKSGCWSEVLSPWIHTVSIGVKCGAEKSCEVFSVCSPRSCIVPPEVSEASRSAKEVLVQGNVTYTCDTEYIIGAFATLTREFTRTCLFDSITSSDGDPITSVSTCSEFVRWWEDATSASSLAGAVITRDRKASRKTWLKSVSRKTWPERRGRTTWPEGVVGRRDRKAWSENLLLVSSQFA